jgi:hypothetical protein
MRISLISCFISFFFFHAGGLVCAPFPPAEKSFLVCLELVGKIRNNALRNDSSFCKVELLCDDAIVDLKVLGGKTTKFKFNLRPNVQFTIRISRPEYDDMIIAVDTHLPSKNKRIHRFYFTTNLQRTKDPGIRHDLRPQSPLALVYFHPKRGYFYYKKFRSRKTQNTKRTNIS